MRIKIDIRIDKEVVTVAMKLFATIGVGSILFIRDSDTFIIRGKSDLNVMKR